MKHTDTVLDTILRDKADELTKLKSSTWLFEAFLRGSQNTVKRFSRSSGEAGKIACNCWNKKASPSGGLIRSDFNPLTIAHDYETSGLVDAISIITETKHFRPYPLNMVVGIALAESSYTYHLATHGRLPISNVTAQDIRLMPNTHLSHYITPCI